MRKSLDRTVFVGAKVLVATLFVMVNFLVGEVRAAGGCGCMDVALVVDNTGSMGGAIDNVRAELPAIIATAQAASCGDLRIGLVTFPNDNVVVNQPFTTNITAVQNAVQALVASGTGRANPSPRTKRFSTSSPGQRTRLAPCRTDHSERFGLGASRLPS